LTARPTHVVQMRRRGGQGREYERAMECGFDGGSRGGGGDEWDEYYSKEVRKAKKGRSPLVYALACVVVGALGLGLVAAASADEGESTAGAALRLLHLA
jgi:hypothetical protein